MQEIEVLQLLEETRGLCGEPVFAFTLLCCLGPGLATQDLLDLNQTTPNNICGMQPPSPALTPPGITSHHLTKESSILEQEPLSAKMCDIISSWR